MRGANVGGPKERRLRYCARVDSDAVINRSEGRALFGADPAAYDRGRPAYPDRVYQILRERCDLAEGTATLDVGAGTGLSTRRLLEFGANPLLAIEPDERLASILTDALRPWAERTTIAVEPFESARLQSGAFDLVTAATSFHWIDEHTGLDQAFRALRPGGALALWWNLFGDESRPDAFHRATSHLFTGGAESPSAGAPGRERHALDVERRTAALRSAGFEAVEHELVTWTAAFDGEQIRALYSTFSAVTRLDPVAREQMIEAVQQVAQREFDDHVELSMLTSVYTARRP